jgi:hypothetical protein
MILVDRDPVASLDGAGLYKYAILTESHHVKILTSFRFIELGYSSFFIYCAGTLR